MGWWIEIWGLRHIPYRRSYSSGHSLWMHNCSRFHRQISRTAIWAIHHLTGINHLPSHYLNYSSHTAFKKQPRWSSRNRPHATCYSSLRLYPALHASAWLKYWGLRFTYFHSQSNLDMVVRFRSFRSEIGQYQNTLWLFDFSIEQNKLLFWFFISFLWPGLVLHILTSSLLFSTSLLFHTLRSRYLTVLNSSSSRF